MMNTKDLVSAVINSKDGWAVREQFEVTFSEEEEFEEQNYNALTLIQKACKDLLKASLLCEDSQEDLEAYVERLSEYLKQA